MGIKSQANACRIHYGVLKRVSNAPMMLVMKHTWGYHVEVKETAEMMFETLEACCVWEAKAKGIDEWTERYEDNE